MRRGMIRNKYRSVTEEWWRERYRQTQSEKAGFERYLLGRQRENAWFWGSMRYPISVVGNKIYVTRTRTRAQLDEPKRTLCGKLFKNGWMGLHQKRAPRWLRNWAKGRSFVALLPKLDRPTLDAFLMIGALKKEEKR
ncbi:MAG: hypothetical protein L0Z53_06670 [Acidobacteriales bacterium]|nr:hypothetical protein [Terriglobales bacterium]